MLRVDHYHVGDLSGVLVNVTEDYLRLNLLIKLCAGKFAAHAM